jgi:hypothetical protein
MFKPIHEVVASANTTETSIDGAGIKRVFMVMHGFYGNLFLSKYATGSLENGEDQGIANARKVWAHSLREYDADTVKLALRRCQERHAEFPPSLPQFASLCAAIKPRETYRPPMGRPALAMSPELREQIVQGHREKANEAARKSKEPPPETGMNLLKRAIAAAVADAGGDEVAELLRLDRMLAPKVTA